MQTIGYWIGTILTITVIGFLVAVAGYLLWRKVEDRREADHLRQQATLAEQQMRDLRYWVDAKRVAPTQVQREVAHDMIVFTRDQMNSLINSR